MHTRDLRDIQIEHQMVTKLSLKEFVDFGVF